MYKIVNRFCNVLSVLMVVIVIAVGAVMILPKITGNDIYAVMSGSMEPYYHVGSVVIIEKGVAPESIEVGDPIVFREGEIKAITHRVIAIDWEQQQFRTKGDANETEDLNPVRFENLIGKAGISIPYLGYLPLYMKTPKGMFGIAAYVILFILLQIIPELLKPDELEKEAQSNEKCE